MRKTSARFELHSAAKMRIEDLFVDAQCENGEGIPTNVRTDIDDVINGTHKTFRYMLVTGLLAAVTDVKLHPRCLQVTSGVDGAFDARSFCQEVIVPFEKILLPINGWKRFMPWRWLGNLFLRLKCRPSCDESRCRKLLHCKAFRSPSNSLVLGVISISRLGTLCRRHLHIALRER